MEIFKNCIHSIFCSNPNLLFYSLFLLLSIFFFFIIINIKVTKPNTTIIQARPCLESRLLVFVSQRNYSLSRYFQYEENNCQWTRVARIIFIII